MHSRESVASLTPIALRGVVVFPEISADPSLRGSAPRSLVFKSDLRVFRCAMHAPSIYGCHLFLGLAPAGFWSSSLLGSDLGGV